MRRFLRAAPHLGRAHWRDLFLAQWLVTRAQLRLWVAAPGSLVDGTVATRERTDGAPLDRTVVERAAWAVDRVLAFGPVRARCLARAITLRDLLARRGVDEAVVRVGVRRIASRIDAHAWVELRGHVIGERVEHVRQFTVLAGLSLVDDR